MDGQRPKKCPHEQREDVGTEETSHQRRNIAENRSRRKNTWTRSSKESIAGRTIEAERGEDGKIPEIIIQQYMTSSDNDE